jgi:predicted Zn-dependent peptidase
MLEELEGFRTTPVEEGELTQAINYLAGQSEVERQSAGALAGEMLEAWLIGGGLSDLDDPAAAFRAVTWEDVLQVAQANLDPVKRAEGVVRGTSLRPPVDD